ncbi:hypothetical protein DFH27DRAFT_566813 [Peziza echinospora]|nr:hypothetical protein DFH27DRAFT_566813 [Peziza echinospora]
MEESNTPPSLAATIPTSREATRPRPMKITKFVDSGVRGTLCVDTPPKAHLVEYNLLGSTGTRVSVTKKWLCKTLRINETEWLALCDIVHAHLENDGQSSQSLTSLDSRIWYWTTTVKRLALGLLRQTGRFTAQFEAVARWKEFLAFGWGLNVDEGNHNSAQLADGEEETALKILSGMLFTSRPLRRQYPLHVTGWLLWSTICLVRRAERRTYTGVFRGILAQEGFLRHDAFGDLSQEYLKAVGTIKRRNATNYVKGLEEFLIFNRELKLYQNAAVRNANRNPSTEIREAESSTSNVEPST